MPHHNILTTMLLHAGLLTGTRCRLGAAGIGIDVVRQRRLIYELQPRDVQVFQHGDGGYVSWRSCQWPGRHRPKYRHARGSAGSDRQRPDDASGDLDSCHHSKTTRKVATNSCKCRA